MPITRISQSHYYSLMPGLNVSAVAPSPSGFVEAIYGEEDGDY